MAELIPFFITLYIVLEFFRQRLAKKTFIWLFVILPICVAIYAYSMELFFSLLGGLFVFGLIAMVFDAYKKSKALRLS